MITSHISPAMVNRQDFVIIPSCPAGLQTTAGQQSRSGQNWVLTGQILGLPGTMSAPLLTRSEKFHYLIIKRDNICFRNEKIRNVKLDKLVVEKLPVLANLHDVVKSCQDRKSSYLPLFYLL